ncbi:MAG: Hsp20/alpha crystallin family protein [Planctomycetaceae bacterium]
MNCTRERCRPVNVFEELDRGLHQFVRGVLSPETQGIGIPLVTLVEMQDRYRMECDLPGIALDDISVSVEDYVLTITGQRKPTELQESAKLVLNERPAREFSRSIQLAKNADVKAVDAELSNGVLVVTIMKRSEVRPQKIQIRRSGSES